MRGWQGCIFPGNSGVLVKLPYKQDVGGSKPSAPTRDRLTSRYQSDEPCEAAWLRYQTRLGKPLRYVELA